ncbi:MAG TPA: shikimate dehydrogenase [Casimicrobiaceae bacterium]
MATMRRAACVMGWPVKHSRAPIIHGYWIEKHGLEADFRLEAVRPEEFPDFLAHLAERGYVGGSATMPHKEIALKLTEPDARAKAIGAANVIWLDAGKLRSTNSDVEGFIAALDESAVGWDRALDKAVVFGAGGAARAVAYGLLQRGVERIHVHNRTLAKAKALRERFGPKVLPTTDEALPSALGGAGLIVNTTSLGMAGNPDLDVDLSAVRTDAVVADVVYVPLETGLLRRARARGLRVSDGLGMLLHQACTCFEKWFRIRPVVTPELRARVEQALRGS